MVKTAVILAAGMGTRLKERTKNQPKAFLEVGGMSLIKRSLENLIESGITRIIIGTGYLKEHFENLKNSYPSLEFVHNEIYDQTSSMYTLYLMKDVIGEDFLLLESDLLYSKEFLKFTIESKSKNVIASSLITDYGDEVFLETDNEGRLVNLSKKRDDLSKIDSVLVGISKISNDTFINICNKFASKLEENIKKDYEHLLCEMGKVENIHVEQNVLIPWCEIDDENHLNYALENILPRI